MLKEYKFFNNMYIPAVVLVLLYLFGNKNEIFFKIVICLAIPIAVTYFLYKKISKTELEKKMKIKIIISTFFLEMLFCVQIFFWGIPIIPYIPAPFNNLLFLGAIMSIICISLWKKKYNKGIIIIILITSWTLIFLYQIFVNLIKIKGM